jgi:hypothetical protein
MGQAESIYTYRMKTKRESSNKKDKNESINIELKEHDLMLKKVELRLKQSEYDRYIADLGYVSSTYDLVLLARRLEILQTLCVIANVSSPGPTFDDIIILLKILDHDIKHFEKLKTVFDNNTEKNRRIIEKLYT